MRSPAASASARRLSTMTARPSLIAMPFALWSKVRGVPFGDRACVFEKHRKPNGLCTVSMPPAIARLLRPDSSSLTAIEIAANEDAQAASTVKFRPPKSMRLATRPAATLSSVPAKDSSVHSGRRSQTLASGVSTKRGSSARTAYWVPRSPRPPPAPSTIEVFSRSKSPSARPASARPRRATSSVSSCIGSIAFIDFGGMP